MMLAAYMVAGFAVATVTRSGILRGRRDPLPLHRASRIAFIPAAVADPVPDLRRRHRGPGHRQRPAGQVRRHGVRPAHHPARPRMARRHLGQRPRLRPASRSRTSTRCWSGSSQHPGDRLGQRAGRADGRPRSTLIHLASTLMVGLGMLSCCWPGCGPPGLVAPPPAGPASAVLAGWGAVGGVAAVVAMEAGWVVTEVGRQPWVVYRCCGPRQAATTRRRADRPERRSSSCTPLLASATFAILRCCPAAGDRGRASPRSRSRTAPPGPPATGPQVERSCSDGRRGRGRPAGRR